MVLPRSGRDGVAPQPSLRLTGDAARLWRKLWATPESTQWAEVADAPAVTRMVLMQVSPMVQTDARLLAELRQLEDRFGLNAGARRQLHWVLDGEQEAEVEQVADVRRLRAVDPGAVAGA